MTSGSVAPVSSVQAPASSVAAVKGEQNRIAADRYNTGNDYLVCGR